jgi:hypothetical protein
VEDLSMLERLPERAILLLSALLAPAAMAAQDLPQVPADHKLIEWGWDEPGPAYMRANAARMDSSGFDGVIFHADTDAGDFTWECWGSKQFRYEDFASTVADLKAAHGAFERMTDNFLRFIVCPGTVDWFDDEAFAVVLGNAEVAARVAAEGGCKGLMFDIEVYKEPLFALPSSLTASAPSPSTRPRSSSAAPS